MSLDKKVKNVLKKELEASEELRDIVQNYDWDNIDREFLDIGSTLINRADDPQRKKTVLFIMARIGQSIESKEMVEFSKTHLEEWKDKYE